MTTMTLRETIRTYRNNGQHAEQVLRFTLTGEIRRADNVRHDLGTDALDLQVKSARATVCKGTDIDAYLALDAAERFAYVESTFTKAYIMSREEYREFVERFATATRESHRNGGAEKLRLKSESREMLAWLEEHCEG